MLILVALPVLFQVTFVVLMLGVMRHVEIIETINQIIQNERNCQLIAVQQQWLKSPQAETDYLRVSQQLVQDIKILKKLVPEQKELIEELKTTTKQLIDVLAKLQVYDSNVPQSREALAIQLASQERAFNTITNKLKPELMLGSLRIDERISQDSRMIKFIIVSSLALNILLSLLLAISFNLSTTRRLLALAENYERLASGASLLPVVEGNDEISAVDRAFREMALALEKAQSREKVLINNAIDVICSMDSNLHFTTVSPSSKTIVGREPRELHGQLLNTICVDNDPSLRLKELKSAESRESISLEFSIRKPDGSVCEIVASVLWSPGQQEFFMVMHDMSERKQAERLLQLNEAKVRLIVQSLPVGLLIIDQGTVEMSNNAANKMFAGATPPADLRGVLVKNLTGPDLETDENGSTFRRVPARRLDGTTFPAHVLTRTFSASEGPQVLMIAVDITERESLERLKQDIVALISHELRTPLTSMRAFLALLASKTFGSLNEDGVSYLARMDKETLRLISLVNDLLDMEKLETNQLSLQKSITSSGAIVSRALDAVGGLARQNDVVINVPAESISFSGDEDRLVQVMINLLSNAVKYSPPRMVIVVQVAVKANEIEFSVKDEGCGIPARYKQSIFEKFQQVESAEHRRKGSTGLGLAICKAIVEQHGGQISVESEQGAGSLFTFTLPRV